MSLFIWFLTIGILLVVLADGVKVLQFNLMRIKDKSSVLMMESHVKTQNADIMIIYCKDHQVQHVKGMLKRNQFLYNYVVLHFDGLFIATKGTMREIEVFEDRGGRKLVLAMRTEIDNDGYLIGAALHGYRVVAKMMGDLQALSNTLKTYKIVFSLMPIYNVPIKEFRWIALQRGLIDISLLKKTDLGSGGGGILLLSNELAGSFVDGRRIFSNHLKVMPTLIELSTGMSEGKRYQPKTAVQRVEIVDEFRWIYDQAAIIFLPSLRVSYRSINREWWEDLYQDDSTRIMELDFKKVNEGGAYFEEVAINNVAIQDNDSRNGYVGGVGSLLVEIDARSIQILGGEAGIRLDLTVDGELTISAVNNPPVFVLISDEYRSTMYFSSMERKRFYQITDGQEIFIVPADSVESVMSLDFGDSKYIGQLADITLRGAKSVVMTPIVLVARIKLI